MKSIAALRPISSVLFAGLVFCGAAGNLAAQVTLTTLTTLGSSSAVGANPDASLVEGSDGNFYGTTQRGGMVNWGTVFQITPGGSYSNLLEFGYDGFPFGGFPTAPLMQGADGNFYGVTSAGGTTGDGVVFQISPGGSYTNLHTFKGNPDGSNLSSGSYAGLVQGSDGNFYGTTSEGGTNDLGTIFQMTPQGAVNILYSFAGPPDSSVPLGGLVQGNDGNFYGTTAAGGATPDGNTFGFGTVFQLNTNGLETVLHSFGEGASATNGSIPEATLVQGNDGNFYGTTLRGGTYDSGTIFRISPGGDYTNLYSFGATAGDGAGNPVAGLVQGSDGNFYGTTSAGGENSYGSVFRISPGGSYTNLHSFVGGDDRGGNQPIGGLVQGSDGGFYGTTEEGGTNDAGTVYKLVVPLNPPANEITAIQMAGTNVLVSISSVANEIYKLQYRTSLIAGAWANVSQAPVVSIGGSLTVTNLGEFLQPQQFYRFAITP